MSAEAPEAQQYTGSLPALFELLRTELLGSPRGMWVRRRMARGAVVSLSRDAANRRVLLLSRPTAPTDARGAKAWDGEVQTFLRWFSAQHWQQVYDLPPRAFTNLGAGVWSAFIEPEDIRTRPT